MLLALLYRLVFVGGRLRIVRFLDAQALTKRIFVWDLQVTAGAPLSKIEQGKHKQKANKVPKVNEVHEGR